MTLHAETLDLVEGRVGQVLRDKWIVESLIGIGGMAAVYAATHRNGNRVALKILHAGLSVDANIRTRFTREGYVANLISHHGIVRVLDDDITDDGSVFLVMDLLEGETAEARARRLGGRLPLEDVILITDGLLDVIAAAHDAGVIHRDIKPENVFFTNERQVKVLDFGIARLREGFGGVSAVKTAAMMGTPAFMPPEQALGRMGEVDALSDVWAVGSTMFNLISGQLVHEAETPNELLILAATAAPRSLGDVSPEVPTAIVEIVDRALAVDKANRWSSARAMQHALHRAADEIMRSPLPPPTNPKIRINTSPQAFRPMGAFREPTGFDETLVENEWNVPSGVSGVIALDGTMPAPPQPGTSTLHGVNVKKKPPPSSGRRVLAMAGIASACVLVAGAIGIGLALRSSARTAQATESPASRAAPPAAIAIAPPTPTTNTPSDPPTLTAAPLEDNTLSNAPPALELDHFVAEPNVKHTPPSAPRAAERASKKSWLDRRK